MAISLLSKSSNLQLPHCPDIWNQSQISRIFDFTYLTESYDLQASQLDGRHFQRPTTIRPMRWQLQRAVSELGTTAFKAFSAAFSVACSSCGQTVLNHCGSDMWRALWGDQALDASKRQNRGSTDVSMETYLILLYIWHHMTHSYDTSYFYSILLESHPSSCR